MKHKKLKLQKYQTKEEAIESIQYMNKFQFMGSFIIVEKASNKDKISFIIFIYDS